MQTTTAIDTAHIRREWATRASFFTGGIGLSAWAPLVPYARDRLRASDAQLGLVMLALGIGSLVAMPLAGVIAARIGCRRLIVTLGLISAACLPGLATAPGYTTLVPLLFVYGAALGSMDVAINLHAVMVERGSGRNLMSGFHGWFSVGCIAGAGGIAGLLAVGASPVLATLPAVVIVLAGLAWMHPHLLDQGGDRGAGWRWPHGRLVVLGMMCFATFLTEGAVLDWSAVGLRSLQDVATARSGAGFAVFAVTMTFSRLCGDRWVARTGPIALLIGGSAIAVAGLLMAAWSSTAPTAVCGYALAGLGAANVAPIVFSSAGRQADGNTQAAVASVSTMGYAGSLVGPACVGLIAHALGLAAAISAVAFALALAVIAGARSASR